ncbi:MAG: hypothetical protein JO061_02720 [Acidobacteriaceae bacterium]|nr:hypothetical protein [Acidobacteriaceae bacterium]
MNEPSDWRHVVKRLVEALPKEASAETEARLLMAFRAQRRRAVRARVYWIATAACLALSLAWFWAQHSSRMPRVLQPGRGTYYANGMPGFVALPYAESGVPLEEAVVVRVQLRPSELGLMGLKRVPAGINGSVQADLLVGQDGIARAVRLVE